MQQQNINNRSMTPDKFQKEEVSKIEATDRENAKQSIQKIFTELQNLHCALQLNNIKLFDFVLNCKTNKANEVYKDVIDIKQCADLIKQINLLAQNSPSMFNASNVMFTESFVFILAVAFMLDNPDIEIDKNNKNNILNTLHTYDTNGQKQETQKNKDITQDVNKLFDRIMECLFKIKLEPKNINTPIKFKFDSKDYKIPSQDMQVQEIKQIQEYVKTQQEKSFDAQQMHSIDQAIQNLEAGQKEINVNMQKLQAMIPNNKYLQMTIKKLIVESEQQNKQIKTELDQLYAVQKLQQQTLKLATLETHNSKNSKSEQTIANNNIIDQINKYIEKIKTNTSYDKLQTAVQQYCKNLLNKQIKRLQETIDILNQTNINLFKQLCNKCLDDLYRECSSVDVDLDKCTTKYQSMIMAYSSKLTHQDQQQVKTELNKFTQQIFNIQASITDVQNKFKECLENLQKTGKIDTSSNDYKKLTPNQQQKLLHRFNELQSKAYAACLKSGKTLGGLNFTATHYTTLTPDYQKDLDEEFNEWEALQKILMEHTKNCMQQYIQVYEYKDSQQVSTFDKIESFSKLEGVFLNEAMVYFIEQLSVLSVLLTKNITSYFSTHNTPNIPREPLKTQIHNHLQ